jgi:hypothetical protein
MKTAIRRLERLAPMRVRKLLRKAAPFALLPAEGDRGIAERGHRNYVGGRWDEIGQLQFDFLVSKGLTPDSYLLDIACGSLRLGVKAIPYLAAFHYLGIEKESGLVRVGLDEELNAQVREEKDPQFVISDSFEFDKFGQKADFAIAQSLFTHLPAPLVDLCFERLLPWLGANGVFYATFHETQREIRNPRKPHAHGYFAYTETQMLGFGERSGFTSNYIGDWGHPVGQMMVEYRPYTTENPR